MLEILKETLVLNMYVHKCNKYLSNKYRRVNLITILTLNCCILTCKSIGKYQTNIKNLHLLVIQKEVLYW